VSISDESEVYETLMKLVLLRINGIYSLLKWVKSEKNEALKDTVSKLYDVAVLWSTIQRDFAERNFEYGEGLREILRESAALDVIQFKINRLNENIDKLRKQVEIAQKNKDVELTAHVREEITKMIDVEEELHSEYEVKQIKLEIFKSSKMRTILANYMKAHLELSTKMNLIFSSALTIVEQIPDIPSHLSSKPKTFISSMDQVVPNLAQNLNLPIPDSPISITAIKERPLSNSIFHVQLDSSHQTIVEQNKRILPGLLERLELADQSNGMQNKAYQSARSLPSTHNLLSSPVWETDLDDFVVIGSRMNAPNNTPPQTQSV
jgi:hypothetical protein